MNRLPVKKNEVFFSHGGLFGNSEVVLVLLLFVSTKTIGPPHNKTNKITVLTVKTQIRLGSLIKVSAVRMKKAWVLSYPLSAQRRL